MARKHYTGKAGHLAAMSELCFRGYNVAMPEVDIGDDIFVVNDATGGMSRVQVKTGNPREQKNSSAYQFRLRASSIATRQNPDLHFVFVMRYEGAWRFLVLSRQVLNNYVRQFSLGSASGEYHQVGVTMHRDGRVMGTNGVDLRSHMDDWSDWPETP